ncbi:MAG: methyltransferase domain-containing protein [Candidatus Falkowbacteria bacterium]|nr:methyltransferase domain-containing protein [Candidatus Falkowbacteria bacterium]
MNELGVKNYSTICANVELIPLAGKGFDKALAIDIIEHVLNPEKFCCEAHRLLKNNGELLITFPAMHDRYIKLFSLIGRYILDRKKKEVVVSGWNPDDHNHNYSLPKWISLVSSCGFKFKKSRATTMFPPLHLYGVPRFWFANDIVYKFDSFFCRMPLIKSFGQSLVCVFYKK